MLLPSQLNTQEIRILQEFRRIGAESMSIEEIRAIKHPAGGGDIPAWSLVQKGYLSADEGKENLSLTDLAKEFLSYNPVPETSEESAS